MMNLPIDNQLEIRNLEQMFAEDGLTTSYKLFWFNGILKEIAHGNQELPFRRLVIRMIAASWYPLLQFKLHFGVADKLHDIVLLIQLKYNLEIDCVEEKLISTIEQISDPEIEKRIQDFYRYVPFRLITPFFASSLIGIKDVEKNKMISNLSNSDDKCIYRIIENEKKLYIRDIWFEYIYKNQSILYGWLNFKMVNYLQRKNPNVPAISLKLSAPVQRDLAIAKKFWTEVNKNIPIVDIYSGYNFSNDNIQQFGEVSIDHFIPWSFVLHDQLWNLVPTFKNLNSSKGNRLPNVDKYLNGFCDMQYKAFSFMINNKHRGNWLEDYLNINRNYDLNRILKNNEIVEKREFEESLKNTIMPVYQIAYNQGYSVWNRVVGEN